MDLAARRVLLCLRYGIGDVVMELPAVEALRRALPEAHITALGASPATQLLERSRNIDEVASLNQWGVTHRWDWGPPGADGAISAWLDEHDFDLFLDVHHVTPAFGNAVWSRGIRSLEADEAAERAALQRGENGVAAIKAAVHAGWGLEVPRWTLPRVTPPQADREFADDFLRRRGLEDTTPLAISPVASLSLKRWPIERLARVADDLVEETDEPILAFCGPQESAAETLRNQMRHGERVVPVGAINLLRVAALLKRCRAFVCNDTGLMHLAGAVGTPTVAIFGPTAAAVYRPPGKRVVSVGQEAVECPHHSTSSLHPPACFAEDRCLIAEQGCIHRTTEEDVRRALDRLLNDAEEQTHPTATVR